MSRILFCWELGGGYGHIGGFLPIAIELRNRGHEVIFAIRELTHAENILGRHGFRYIQAPIWLAKLKSATPAVNYAEILFSEGWLSQQGLGAQVKAWLELIGLVAPDLLVIDHGPAVLLATRDRVVPRAMIGSGFFCPPRVSPLPSIRPEAKPTREHLLAAERKALTIANSVLGKLRLPMLQEFADLFDVDETFLSTFSELDHYPQRSQAQYYGPVMSLDEGDAFAWPVGDNPRIFAYIKPGHADFENILEALRNLPARVIVHAPGVSEIMAGKYQSPNLFLHRSPLSMSQATHECDVGICHAGMGTVSALLLAGRPILLLPTQQEQAIVSQSVVALGCGIMVSPAAKFGTAQYKKSIKQLLDSRFTANAREFATRYAEYKHNANIAAIASRCEALLRAARPLVININN